MLFGGAAFSINFQRMAVILGGRRVHPAFSEIRKELKKVRKKAPRFETSGIRIARGFAWSVSEFRIEVSNARLTDFYSKKGLENCVDSIC